MSSNNIKLKNMLIIALFASIISILAQLSIPMPLGVPITGQTLGIGLAATILGARKGTYATILYIILGAIGLPVFAQMQGGLGVILGPTGGYIIGFIPTAYFTGLILEKFHFTFRSALCANLLGMIITQLIGTLWLKWVAALTMQAAFVAGFLPFIIVGIIKAIFASILGLTVRKRLIQARLL